MRTLSLVLKILSPLLVLAGILHLVFGIGADVMLGARLPPEALADPALDSQNRFYGTAFTLYGFLLFVCATDLSKYATIFRWILWVMFAAGMARVWSIATHGLPPAPVVGLLLSELLAPPLLHVWHARALRGS